MNPDDDVCDCSCHTDEEVTPCPTACCSRCAVCNQDKTTVEEDSEVCASCTRRVEKTRNRVSDVVLEALRF